MWKWVATNIVDHTLPNPGASLIKQAESAISVIKGTSVALSLFLVIMFIITIIFLDTFIKHRTQTLHLSYVRFHYGDTVETTARTYANLIKFHSERLQSGIGIGADMTNIFLIGAGETAEAYLCHDREFADDDILQSLLPQAQPFVFRTITDALHTLDDLCCTSKRKLPRTLFVLLLISTRDPSLERHEHEAFQMPSSLRDHCYAIVGTGLGGNGAPAHKLSKGSKGPNGERLIRSMPNIASVCFC